MDRLIGVVQHYDWGSTTALTGLRGEAPSGRPEAELWFGAHPAGPSKFASDGRTATVGELPVLAKFLAVARPLSLQVHPDDVSAALGHQLEEEDGLAADDPRRCFPDPVGKPEVVLAVERFISLCGLLPATEALAGAQAAGLPDVVVDPLADGDLAGAVVAALAADHPDDPAQHLVPLLRRVVLEPGDALFVSPGMLHTHLSGLAVEVMPRSDSVARAGLTTKHVDVETVLDLVDSEAVPEILRPRDGDHAYDLPTDAFAVRRLCQCTGAVGGGRPTVVVCAAGRATAKTGGMRADEVTIGAGEAMWLGPDDGPVEVCADGTAYLVAPGSATLGS
ncbi:MAG: type I phosphomannose isomerase catalytic subunit [Actinomycetota bacterium]|nr:type I phosphomannose isomerase catalytic subunit [Actinomycetota bacterium]